MLAKLKLLYNTTIYLKPEQIKYQLFNRLRRKRPFAYYAKEVNFSLVNQLRFRYSIPQFTCYLGNLEFRLLNIAHQFCDEVDWNFLGYGKLWNYNLQYANWLNQKEGSIEEKLQLLKSLQTSVSEGVLQLEPYPVSLRSINVMRFISSHDVNDFSVIHHLYTELTYLNKNLEFHILGNHLLENLFTLAMGGAFFNREDWHNHAVDLLTRELKEQIHNDGAHFELSPMYHQIIYYRLLELIDWYDSYKQKDPIFLKFCNSMAQKMSAWLNNVTFDNGDIPLFNDAAKDIAFSTEKLNKYSEVLDIKSADLELTDSGYRSFVTENYEIKMDLAQIGATYQAGHAHADALGFIVYHDSRPLFVEQGTSTYEKGERRQLERSTEAHNCVVISNRNQSEVWGGFRTGGRAKTTILSESGNKYVARHDGYRSLDTIHTRIFELNKNEIIVTDNLSSDVKAVLYLHLHHQVSIEEVDEFVFSLENGVKIVFEGATSTSIERYKQSESYNCYCDAGRLKVAFKNSLISRIEFCKN